MQQLVVRYLVIIILFSITSCGSDPEPTKVAVEPTNTALPPTETSVPPTKTLVLPTETPPPTATATSIPTATATPTAVPPTPTPEPLTAVVAENNSAIRKGAGSDYDRISVLETGTELTLLSLSTNDGWYSVEMTDGTRGWIENTLVEDLDEAVLNELETAEVTLTADVNANVRTQPGGSVLVSVPASTDMRVISVNTDFSWFQVEIPNDEQKRTGWVSASIINPIDEADLPSITRAPAPVAVVPPTPASSSSEATDPPPAATTSSPPPSTAANAIIDPWQNPAFTGTGRMSFQQGQQTDDACRGLTFVLQYQLDGVVYVGADQQTNPYRGDTPCGTALPLVCIFKDGVDPPPDNYTYELFYSQNWAGGRVAYTAPIAGTSLTSVEAANQICANTFGNQFWVMAEFHDGNFGQGGWGFWASGTLPIGVRFWVYIDDQPSGNPWAN